MHESVYRLPRGREESVFGVAGKAEVWNSKSAQAMKTTDIEKRTRMFWRRDWTREEFEDWYRLDFDDGPTRKILAWAGLCGGTWREPGEPFEGTSDHWEFEKFMELRGLLTVPDAAAWLSLSVPDYRRVIAAFRESPGNDVLPAPGDSKCFVSKFFVSNLHRGFEGGRRLWAVNHTFYISKLHELLKSELGVDVETVHDAFSVECPDLESEASAVRDIVTGEAISQSLSVPLSFGKPIMLTIDYVSLKTYAAHEKFLSGLATYEIDEGRLECARRLLPQRNAAPARAIIQ